MLALATSAVKSAAPMAWVMPEFLDMLQDTPWVYTFAEPSAFMKRLV